MMGKILKGEGLRVGKTFLENNLNVFGCKEANRPKQYRKNPLPSLMRL
jgi:hypothetical protein